MILQFTKDNVGKFHIELLNDDNTPLLPRDGFESHKQMCSVASEIMLDASNAHIDDLTAIKIYAE